MSRPVPRVEDHAPQVVPEVARRGFRAWVAAPWASSLRATFAGSPSARRRSADLALAVVVTGLSLAGFFLQRPTGADPGVTDFVSPGALGALALSVAGLSLAWRRVVPGVVLVVCAADLSVRFAQDYPVTFLPLAVIVAVFTVADLWPTSTALVSTAAAALAPAVSAFTLLDPESDDNLLLSLGLYAALSFAVGVAWRHRRLGAHTAVRRAEVLYDRARQLSREQQDVAGIASELHDAVASNLGLIVAQARAASSPSSLPGPEDPRDTALRGVEALGRETLSELRRIIGVWLTASDEGERAPTLDSVFLLIERVNSVGTVVNLYIHHRPRPLPPVVELTAYRIVQEAMTNALRHGPGLRIDVELTYGVDDLEVAVTDRCAAGQGGHADGRHRASQLFPDPGFGTGHGIAGMRRRAESLGGHVELRTVGGDYTVRATLPVPRQVAPQLDRGVGATEATPS